MMVMYTQWSGEMFVLNDTMKKQNTVTYNN